MKQALGITGVGSTEYSWRSAQKKGGAQIDLLIDRQDQLINVCEMKYTQEPFDISESYEGQLMHKISQFAEETGTQKAIHLTMVTAAGLAPSAYTDCVQNVITMDDLFAG